MKNIGLSLALLLLLASCSSGTTVADTPFNITGVYLGEYENISGSIEDTLTLNIVEDQSGIITGNILFNFEENDRASVCGTNSTVDGSTTGFTVQFSVGGSAATDVSAGSGGISYQLTQSNSGRTLSGTYVNTGLPECSNASGSGTVTFTR